MAMAKAILAFAALAALAVQLAAAAIDHPVGGAGSWDASGTSYNAWAAKQTFKTGDTLSFKYSTSHDVTEVTKAGYDACSAANPIKSYSDGATSVKLTAPGKRYFICAVPGHCAAGMKLEVTVAAAAVTAPAPAKSKPRTQRSAAPTAAPVPAPAAAAPSTDDEMPNVSTPTAAPAPKSSDAAASAAVLGAKAVVVGLVAMALAAM